MSTSNLLAAWAVYDLAMVKDCCSPTAVMSRIVYVIYDPATRPRCNIDLYLGQ